MKLADYKAEIARLKDIIATLEKDTGQRAARVEYVDGHLVITAPNTQSELEFGKFVAAQVAMLVNAAGLLGVIVGEGEVRP